MRKFTVSQKIVLMAMALIIVIILYLVVKNVSYNLGRKKIDYKNITGETLVNRSTLTNSKAIYFSLSDVITRYVSSYRKVNADPIVGSEDGYKYYTEYYKIISDDYKHSITKNAYYDLAGNFLKKFNIPTIFEENIEPYYTPDTSNIIKNIYQFEENKYIVKLESTITKNNGYIGIELNPINLDWHIFYLE